MKYSLSNSQLSLQELTAIVVHEAYQTYFAYGPGIFERVYEASLAGRLRRRGLKVERQRKVYITDEFVTNEPAFVADIVVEDRLILELKSVQELHPVTWMQLRSYLRLTGIDTGLLINFNCKVLKANIHRVYAHAKAA